MPCAAAAQRRKVTGGLVFPRGGDPVVVRVGPRAKSIRAHEGPAVGETDPADVGAVGAEWRVASTVVPATHGVMQADYSTTAATAVMLTR